MNYGHYSFKNGQNTLNEHYPTRKVVPLIVVNTARTNNLLLSLLIIKDVKSFCN